MAAPSNDSGRSCWVCFATDEDEPLAKWLRPCRCIGSTAWVHENCLTRWVDEKQRGDMSAKVTCNQCNTEYTIWYPELNLVLKLLERANKAAQVVCPILTGGFILGGVYWTAVTYGAITVMQVLGYEDGMKFMERTEPFLLILGLPTIPVLLTVLKMIRWEEAIVQIIHRPLTIHRLYAALTGIPPGDVGIEAGPPLRQPLSATRIFCGAMVLPSIATLTGRLLLQSPQFNHISSFKKALIGGAAFLFVRGLVNIYFQYSGANRRRNRKILNFTGEQHRTANANIQVDIGEIEEDLDEINDENWNDEQNIQHNIDPNNII